jgi:S-adenosylmethionine/arginine decarboxylase-like enzyme
MNTHQHLLISATIKQPPQCEEELKQWLIGLVNKIDMEILDGPLVRYLDEPGNRGISGMVMITTSHIAIHIWDEFDPAYLKMDVYSCKEFNPEDVVEHLAAFHVDKLEVTLLDRSD